MKTSEKSSWNRKWHLKKGNIVNDGRELSLSPTKKNSLNTNPGVIKFLEQKNPQNLIRHRRSDANNQLQDTFTQINVPGDGSCLFWATTLDYLIPVKDNDAEFLRRFKKLFGEGEVNNVEHVRNLIKEYNPFSNSDAIRSNEIFNRLVTERLRNKVVDYIAVNKDRFKNFVTGNFDEYLRSMRNRNSWGGEPEIRAMSNILDATINVDSGGVSHSPYGDGSIPIQLYHVNTGGIQAGGNHYNFGLERNIVSNYQDAARHTGSQLSQTLYQAELVEHLFQANQNNNFQERFQSFIDQIPRPSGVGTAPAKKGFYTHAFAGMFTTLKNTELFDKLGLAELHFKFYDPLILKVVAIKENPTTKRLEEYIFVIFEKRYDNNYKEILFSTNDNEWLKESKILFSTRDGQFHGGSRAHTRANEMDFKFGASVIISRLNGKDKLGIQIVDKLTNKEIPASFKRPFRRIEQHRKHVIGDYKSNLLEDVVKNMHVNDVQEVEKNSKKLLEYVYDINRKYNTNLLYVSGAREAADHGFTVGALMNFKYRYNVKIYSELLLGKKGYIDIVLLVRGNKRVKDAIPILIEMRTGQAQRGRANPKHALMDAESYSKGLQQNSMPFVTYAEQVVRIGFNMDYAHPIEASVASLQPPTPIIRTIFESINSGNVGQERLNDIKTIIIDQLKKTYNLLPGTTGSGEGQHLSRSFIGHSILNSVELIGKKIEKRVFTHHQLKRSASRKPVDPIITTVVFVERTTEGRNAGNNRVLIVHFHESGRSDIDDAILKIPLDRIQGLIQANCKEIIEVYVDARSDGKSSLKFLGEGNEVRIRDVTSSVNDYFGANNARHWKMHNMPDSNQVENLRNAFDAAVKYQIRKDTDNKADLGDYKKLFADMGKILFPLKSLIKSEAEFQAVVSELLNSYSDLNFGQGDFRINIRREFQVGGGGRIDLLISIIGRDSSAYDILIGLELKYGITVNEVRKLIEEAVSEQIVWYGKSPNIKAMTEENKVATLAVGFTQDAKDSNSLIITNEKFVVYDVSHSSLTVISHRNVADVGRRISQSSIASMSQDNTQGLYLEKATREGTYDYWLQQHDVADIARIEYGYGTDTANTIFEVVGAPEHLNNQIEQFKTRVEQGEKRPLTLVVNLNNNHWVTLVIARQNGQYNGYYIDSLGIPVQDNIKQVLQQSQVNYKDIGIGPQQTDGHNCGLWALENARDINVILQEDMDVALEFARKQLDKSGERGEEYFKNKRQDISTRLDADQERRNNVQNIIGAGSSVDSQVSSAGCLSGGRSRRSVNGCLYSWEDVDNFNANKKDPRNVDEITIDAQKFLEYTKNVNDKSKNAQLLSLARERIAASSDNIVGEYKPLLSDVVSDGGYENYKRNERIQYLADDFLSNNVPGVNSRLKQKLFNAAGRIQLIRGIHGTIVSCKDGTTRDCALSVSGLGYAFLAQPIENVMVKVTPKIVGSAGKFAGKFVPRILGHNTKFAVHFLGAKYGTRIAKGVAGAAAGIFDIVEIGISGAALANCTKRANTNDPCSDKEIRDNIASISFSSVSFVAGIILTAAGAPLAATGVGLGLMIGYGIYSGVSNIIEYEEKYDTTHDENWRLFWHTFLLQKPPRDLLHLAARQDAVNNIVLEAWKNLEASPNNIVAYGIGLGAIKFSSITQCRTEQRLAYQPFPDEELGVKAYRGFYNETICEIREVPVNHPATSKIHMYQQNADTGNLSRVLPKPIENATMVCLPEITGADYEKGIKKSVSTAVHYCNNAVVMVHDHRKQQQSNDGDQWGIFDLRLINNGLIGGSNILNNIFVLFEGAPIIIGGDNVNNEFIFNNDTFLGAIILGDNATNTLDMRALTSDVVEFNLNFHFNCIYNASYHINNDSYYYINVFGEKTIKGRPVAHKDCNKLIDRGKLRYIGRKNKVDEITCSTTGGSGYKTYNVITGVGIISIDVFIDSGGGYSNDRKDVIKNCNYNKIVVRPYTEVMGGNGTYTFYVEVQGYEEKNSNSEINVQGKGTIVFPKISLLEECNQITYYSVNNTLSFEIVSGQNGTFTLDVQNYLGIDNKPSFILIDKYGSNIIPKLNLNDNSTTTVNIKRFELYTSYSLDSLSDVRDYYEDISYNEKDYEVFGVIRDKSEKNNNTLSHVFFGSLGSDIISIDKDTVFAEGGEGSDVYIVSDDISGSILISNKSEDKQLDVLTISSKDNVSLNRESYNLKLSITKRSSSITEVDNIVIENYFLGTEYQHLILMDQNGDCFIPFELDEDLTLLPFYHASGRKNVFISPVDIKQVVTDSDLDNMQFYRDSNDLLLLDKKNEGKNSYPLVVVLKDFYLDPLKWQDHQIYTGSYGDYTHHVDLLQKSRRALIFDKQYNYKNIIKEYVVDFNVPSRISHNHRIVNDTLHPVTQGQERIGIIIFKDISPERLKIDIMDDDIVISDKHSEYTVQIFNWCKSKLYAISAFEFDLGLNPIRINGLNKKNCSISYLEEQISTATKLYDVNKQLEVNEYYNSHEYVLKCIMSISALNATDAYMAWGFASLHDQIHFIQNCNLDLFELTRIRDQIRVENNQFAANVQYQRGFNIDLYKNKLLYNLQLQGYAPDKIKQYSNIINEHLTYDNIIDQIVSYTQQLPTSNTDAEHHRVVRAVNQVEETTNDYVVSSTASSISSPINYIFNLSANWFNTYIVSLKNPFSWITELYSKVSSQEQTILVKSKITSLDDDGVSIDVEYDEYENYDKSENTLGCDESIARKVQYDASNQVSSNINKSKQPFVNVKDVVLNIKNSASYYLNATASTIGNIIYNFGTKDSKQCGNSKYYYRTFTDCQYNVPQLYQQVNDLSVSILFMTHLWKKYFRKEEVAKEDYPQLIEIDTAIIELWQDYINNSQELIKGLKKYKISDLEHYAEVLEIRADDISEIKQSMEVNGQKVSLTKISELKENLLTFSSHLAEDIEYNKDFSQIKGKAHFVQLIKKNVSILITKQNYMESNHAKAGVEHTTNGTAKYRQFEVKPLPELFVMQQLNEDEDNVKTRGQNFIPVFETTKVRADHLIEAMSAMNNSSSSNNIGPGPFTAESVNIVLACLSQIPADSRI